MTWLENFRVGVLRAKRISSSSKERLRISGHGKEVGPERAADKQGERTHPFISGRRKKAQIRSKNVMPAAGNAVFPWMVAASLAVVSKSVGVQTAELSPCVDFSP